MSSVFMREEDQKLGVGGGDGTKNASALLLITVATGEEKYRVF